MDIHLPGILRDRRGAASEETTSVAGLSIYGRGSLARTRGAAVGRGDRLAAGISTIILHQTSGRSFTVGDLPPAGTDSDHASDHRVDRITAHFVVLRGGCIVYTRDVEYMLNDAGGREGIDIEFAGRFPNDLVPPSDPARRLDPKAIQAARMLLKELKQRLPKLRWIHPHGQVQSGARGKLHSCPGPDIWMNVGEWAVRHLALDCERPSAYYPNNGISDRQRNAAYDQHVT